MCARQAALADALLDFERAPGRYAIGLREPRPLFDEALWVLQLASGRRVQGLQLLASRGGADEDSLRRAARFFVRKALLRQGNDAAALLGLPPAFSAEQLREHYRLMIRMTHPDFAGVHARSAEEAWPADAAQRINQANDVLQVGLAQGVGVAPAPTQGSMLARKPMPTAVARFTKTPPVGRPVPAQRWWQRIPSSLRWGVVALVGALLCLTALLFMGDNKDHATLAVRKPNSPVVPATPVAPALSDLADPPRVSVLAAVPVTVPSLAPMPAPATPTEPAAAAPDLTRVAQPSPRPPPRQNARPHEAADDESPRLKMAANLSLGSPAQPPPVVQEVPVLAAVATSTSPALRITLADAQPLLVRLIDGVKSGQAHTLVQWIDADWRASPATGVFRDSFDRMLDGRQVTQLGQVSFESSAADGELQVDGTIELDLRDAANRTERRHLHLRVYFREKEGQPVLTRLVAGLLK